LLAWLLPSSTNQHELSLPSDHPSSSPSTPQNHLEFEFSSPDPVHPISFFEHFPRSFFSSITLLKLFRNGFYLLHPPSYLPMP
jgi:hypothetical protein